MRMEREGKEEDAYERKTHNGMCIGSGVIGVSLRFFSAPFFLLPGASTVSATANRTKDRTS